MVLRSLITAAAFAASLATQAQAADPLADLTRLLAGAEPELQFIATCVSRDPALKADVHPKLDHCFDQSWAHAAKLNLPDGQLDPLKIRYTADKLDMSEKMTEAQMDIYCGRNERWQLALIDDAFEGFVGRIEELVAGHLEATSDSK